MTCRKIFRFLVIPIAIAISAPLALATTITIDFSDFGPDEEGGDLGSSTFEGTGVTASGLWKDGAIWKPANLYVRNQTNDHGFGVCSPADDPPCPGPDGGGDWNELDNAGAPELIRLALDLDEGFQWISVQLSSLDDNDDGEPDLEFGRLWADLDGNPDSFDFPIDPNPLWKFQGHETNVEPSFDIPDGAASAPFLFFEPIDWRTNGDNTNNDFLVYQVTIEQTRVAEPTAIGLLGIGLLALRRTRRRR